MPWYRHFYKGGNHIMMKKLLSLLLTALLVVGMVGCASRPKLLPRPLQPRVKPRPKAALPPFSGC